MKKTIASFNIDYQQVLDENGVVDQSLMPNLTESQIKELYHLMKLTRIFDEKLFLLQRSGKIGTYAQVKGQEAQVATGFILDKEDWIAPSFREMGVYIARGVNRAQIVQAWKGDVRANTADPKTARCLPVAVPIATQCLHACGLAWASKLRGEKSACVTYLGDGGTSEGDFYEALNFAGVFKLPVIIYCQNNQWAISTPRSKQSAAQTIAQKAIAAGVEAIQIDGNDVIGVYKAMQDALARARNGQGPTLIEAMTFRMGDHTTSDDSSKYRDPKLVEEWTSKDPLLRLEKYFQKIGTWSDDYGKWVTDECNKEAEAAITEALAMPPPPPENLFAHIYEKLTADLEEEQAEVLATITEQKSQTQLANASTNGGAK